MEANFVKANRYLEQIGDDLGKLKEDKVEDRAGLVGVQGQVTATFASLQTTTKTLEKMVQSEMNQAKKQNARE